MVGLSFLAALQLARACTASKFKDKTALFCVPALAARLLKLHADAGPCPFGVRPWQGLSVSDSA